jgi:hypothetical protein
MLRRDKRNWGIVGMIHPSGHGAPSPTPLITMTGPV